MNEQEELVINYRIVNGAARNFPAEYNYTYDDEYLPFVGEYKFRCRLTAVRFSDILNRGKDAMVRMLPEELPLIHPFRPWEKGLDDNHERLELSFTESGDKLDYTRTGDTNDRIKSKEDLLILYPVVLAKRIVIPYDAGYTDFYYHHRNWIDVTYLLYKRLKSFRWETKSGDTEFVEQNKDKWIAQLRASCFKKRNSWGEFGFTFQEGEASGLLKEYDKKLTKRFYESEGKLDDEEVLLRGFVDGTSYFKTFYNELGSLSRMGDLELSVAGKVDNRKFYEELGKKASVVALEGVTKDVERVSGEVSDKASKSSLGALKQELTQSINSKASKAELTSSLADKASKAELDNKADKSSLSSLASKVDLSKMEKAIELKADKSSLSSLASKAEIVGLAKQSELDNKADKSSLSSLASKVDLSKMEKAIELKADKSSLSSLASKAEIVGLAKQSELDNKADKSSLSSLASKVDLSKMEKAIELKADKSSLSSLASKAEIVGLAKQSELDNKADKSSLSSLASKAEIVGLAKQSELEQVNQTALNAHEFARIIKQDSEKKDKELETKITDTRGLVGRTNSRIDNSNLNISTLSSAFDGLRLNVEKQERLRMGQGNRLGDIVAGKARTDWVAQGENTPYVSVMKEPEMHISELVSCSLTDRDVVSERGRRYDKTNSTSSFRFQVPDDQTLITISYDLSVGGVKYDDTCVVSLGGKTLREYQGGSEFKKLQVNTSYGQQEQWRLVAKSVAYDGQELQLYGYSGNVELTFRGTFVLSNLVVHLFKNSCQPMVTLTESGGRFYGDGLRYVDIDTRKTYRKKTYHPRFGDIYTDVPINSILTIRGGVNLDRLELSEGLDAVGAVLFGGWVDSKGIYWKTGLYAKGRSGKRPEVLFNENTGVYTIYHYIGHRAYLPIVTSSESDWADLPRVLDIQSDYFTMVFINNNNERQKWRERFTFICYKTI